MIGRRASVSSGGSARDRRSARAGHVDLGASAWATAGAALGAGTTSLMFLIAGARLPKRFRKHVVTELVRRMESVVEDHGAEPSSATPPRKRSSVPSAYAAA
jgi:hypothetical protein